MISEGLAPAKINLTLHVTGQRDDGYHLLDSLVVFADTGDRLSLRPADQMEVRISGPFATGVPTDNNNLIWRAAQAADWTGRIDLVKTLPHAAGIGSGSSDAATVLRLLKAQLPAEMVLALGADVPVCVAAKASRMQGIGEVVLPVDLPDLPALLINPGVTVPTGRIFAGLASRNNAAMPDGLPKFEGPGDVAAWLAVMRNDLEAPALDFAPEIADALSDLRTTRDVLLARMSGSGATCFALYPTMKAAHLAAYDIGAAHPDWWCVPTTLR